MSAANFIFVFGFVLAAFVCIGAARNHAIALSDSRRLRRFREPFNGKVIARRNK